jgi:hypothetical protein
MPRRSRSIDHNITAIEPPLGAALRHPAEAGAFVAAIVLEGTDTNSARCFGLRVSPRHAGGILHALRPTALTEARSSRCIWAAACPGASASAWSTSGTTPHALPERGLRPGSNTRRRGAAIDGRNPFLVLDEMMAKFVAAHLAEQLGLPRSLAAMSGCGSAEGT